jgi:hypothetical protein
MTISPAILKRLSALDAPPGVMREMLSILADAMAGEEERLAKQRDRKARHRERMSRDGHGTEDHVTGQSQGQSQGQLPPKERNQTPHVSELRSDTTPVPKTTPRIELEAILGPEHAAAVIDHRQRLGSPLTAHAAKLLAAEFAKCADPDAAADTMIARGWRGFKPKWLEERHNGPAGPPPPKPPTGSAKLVELLKKPFEETYGRSNGQEPSGATVLPIRNR